MTVITRPLAACASLSSSTFAPQTAKKTTISERGRPSSRSRAACCRGSDRRRAGRRARAGGTSRASSPSRRSRSAKITNETYVIAMKSGNLFFDCCEPSVGNQLTPQMKSAERMMPSTVPSDDELRDAFHRRSSRTRCTPRILYPRAPAVQRRRRRRTLCASLRYPGWARPRPAALAPIRTKFALPCAFAAHHAVHSSDRAGGPLCRAGGRASRVCDTRGRPRRSAARGRLGRRHSRGLGGRPAQGRARSAASSRPCAARPRSRAPRSPRRRRPTRSSRRASR